MTDLALPSEQQQPTRRTVATFLHTLTPEIARAMPSGKDADRLARIALTACRKDPALAASTPESFSGALLTAVALGLEPGTPEAWLVAYKDGAASNRAGVDVYECQLIVGYQGLVKLFYQHPLAIDISAELVRAGDEFDWAKGTSPYLRHKPAAPEDRGEITHYYAVARLSTGATPFEVLTREEAKALRGREGPSPRFKGSDPQHWMERKTAIKQLAKLLPKSPRFAAALDADERTGTELRQVGAVPGEVIDTPSQPPALSAGDPGWGDPLRPGEQVNQETGEVTGPTRTARYEPPHPGDPATWGPQNDDEPVDADVIESPPETPAGESTPAPEDPATSGDSPTGSPEQPGGEAAVRGEAVSPAASASPPGDPEPQWSAPFTSTASRQQVGVIQNLANQLGMDDATRHAYAERLIGQSLVGPDGRPTFNRLTVKQAGMVIDALNADLQEQKNRNRNR